MATRQEDIQIDLQLSDGSQAGKTLGDLDKQAKALKKSIKGVEIRSDEYVKKTKDLQKVNGRLKSVRKDMKGVTEVNKELIGQFQQYIPFGNQIGKVTKGVKGLTTGFKGLRGAIAASGIGLLVLVLGALVTWLITSQEGIDKLTAVMRPLQAIVQRLLGLIQDLGGKAFKKLAEALKNPKQAFIDLSNIIKDNIINRFKAIALLGPAIAKIFSGELKDGMKDLANAAVQLGTGVENSIDKIRAAGEATAEWVQAGIDAGTRLDQLQKNIEKQEIILTKRRAELNKEYNEAKEIAQDQSKTEAERLKAAKEASSAQNELLNLEQNFLDLKIAKLKEEHALNDTSREDLLELSSLEAERTNFAAQAAKKRASAKSLENTVHREIAAEQTKLLKQREKEEEAAAKKREAALKQFLAVERSIQDQQLAIMEEGVDKRILQSEIAAQREIESLVGTETQIEEQKRLIKLQLANETDAILKADRISRKDQAIADSELEFQEEKLRLQEEFLAGQITEEERRVAELDALQLHEENKLAILQSSGEATESDVVAQTKAVNDVKEKGREEDLKSEEETKKKKAAILSAGLDQASAAASSFTDLLVATQGEQAKNSKAFKAVQIAGMTIDFFREIQGIWAGASALGPIAGPIVGGLQAGFAGVRYALGLRKVNQQKFARGGIVHGPSHANGGIQMINSQTGQPVGELEGNEYILNTGVTSHPVLRGYADKLNDLGNRRFATGGPLNPLSSSSVPDANQVTEDAAQSQEINTENNSEQTALLQEILKAVKNWPTVVKAVLSLSQFQDAEAELAEAEESNNV